MKSYGNFLIAGLIFGISLIIYEATSYSFSAKNNLGKFTLYDANNSFEPKELFISPNDMVVSLLLYTESYYRVNKPHSIQTFRIVNGQTGEDNAINVSEAPFYGNGSKGIASYRRETFIDGFLYTERKGQQQIEFPENATPGTWVLKIEDIEETNSLLNVVTAQVRTGGQVLNKGMIWTGGLLIVVFGFLLWNETSPRKRTV